MNDGFKTTNRRHLQDTVSAMIRERKHTSSVLPVPGNKKDPVTCEPSRIFLSAKEVIGAIQADIVQYAPQKTLFIALCPLVCGENALAVADAKGDGVWIKTGSRKKLIKMSFKNYGQHLCDVLEKQKYSLDQLSNICRVVFKTSAFIGKNSNGKEKGVWIETGMEDFSCIQCGQCCKTLDYRRECTLADYFRWKDEGREDILEWVGVVKKDGCINSCHIWIEPGTSKYADVCPWLERVKGQSVWNCRIHEVKPTICREYPGTRKHGVLTGCNGFLSKADF